jgi:FdhD protein
MGARGSRNPFAVAGEEAYVRESNSMECNQTSLMDSPGIRDFGVRRHSSVDQVANDVDHLAVEEPLEIVLLFRRRAMLVRKPISITMRTPGQDRELAVGFLYTEGIIHHPNVIEEAAPGADSSITVAVTGDLDLQRLERHFYTSSSCGVCGKASLQALQMNREIHLGPFGPKHSVEFLVQTPRMVREKQSIFDRTGGLHAAALFDPNRNLIRICEDIGRHNAVDKLVGAELLAGRLDFSDLMLFVSGRAGFELIQKSIMSGIPFMSAVGAPSSLSVELARKYGSTLVGFLREDRFNLYSGSERVLGEVPVAVSGTEAVEAGPEDVMNKN